MVRPALHHHHPSAAGLHHQVPGTRKTERPRGCSQGGFSAATPDKSLGTRKVTRAQAPSRLLLRARGGLLVLPPRLTPSLNSTSNTATAETAAASGATPLRTPPPLLRTRLKPTTQQLIKTMKTTPPPMNHSKSGVFSPLSEILVLERSIVGAGVGVHLNDSGAVPAHGSPRQVSRDMDL